jgi:hypothetical protein
MTNQPNTEDGNEWLDEILDFPAYGFDKYEECPECMFNRVEAKQQILSYIQSNYILKSDVADIIGDDQYSYIEGSKEWHSPKDSYCNELRKLQRIKASQYGLTK